MSFQRIKLTIPFLFWIFQSMKIIMLIIEYCNIFAIYKAMCSSQQASQGINVKIPLLTLHQIVLQLKMYTIIISTILDSLYLFSRNNPDYWQLTGCYNSMFSIIIICRIRAEGAEFRFKFQHWCQVFVEFWNMILLLMILSILICICVFTPLIFSSSLIMQKKLLHKQMLIQL